jgi:ribosomal-protein-alanine N-acetyltransferase
MQGTIQLQTKRLLLRKHETEDAKVLHQQFGLNDEMFRYSGWNPYATEAMAAETIQHFIDSYPEPSFYGWAITLDGHLIGTIGAYDYNEAESSIEIGISIVQECWGQGYASEALQSVLEYLTKEEKIKTIIAWCAEENIGSRRVMEKAGMLFMQVEKGALLVNGKAYDKLNFSYHLDQAREL